MIRRELEKGGGNQEPEFLDDELDGYDIKELFLGECAGIGLLSRSLDDPHICFVWLAEDDGTWFENKGYHSTYWLSDYAEVLAAVQEWLRTSAEPEFVNPENTSWPANLPCGYRFKQNSTTTSHNSSQVL